MLTAGQIRAARVMLGWTVVTLALRAGVNKGSIRPLEQHREWLRGRPELVVQIRQAFEAGGITFLDDDGQGGPGLRYRAVDEAVVRRGEDAIG